jgi:hypothetical protein
LTAEELEEGGEGALVRTVDLRELVRFTGLGWTFRRTYMWLEFKRATITSTKRKKNRKKTFAHLTENVEQRRKQIWSFIEQKR